MKKQIPCVIAIAGSDSSGGAGVQADMKTFAALGVYGTCALTAITAQNTLGVSVIYPLTREVVTSQIVSVLEDIPVEFAKVGMVFSQEVIEGIAELIDKYKLKFVLDPVFRAGSGDSLIKEDAKKTLTTKLVPRTEVLTPNIIE
ncbi:MAG: bifunctional hydroxymethylpyrimidine kinase/phosphomethylpyrimidine kinase, partial [Candidatus Bathyarchaeia archaeon]